MTPPSVSSLLSYPHAIEEGLRLYIPRLGPAGPLRDACAYALLGKGKRVRPALVLMLAEALGRKEDAMQAALAIEFFHTASLIADDLPCMDNAVERRGQPALHCVYGEATALLATYALIAAGYGAIAENSRLMLLDDKGQRCMLALEQVSRNTGLYGATGGQFSDLSLEAPSLSSVQEVLHQKTVTLFESAFVLGWLFGGGEIHALEKVKAIAGHFGMAFQIADDLEDQEEDRLQSRQANLALWLGEAGARVRLAQELTAFRHQLSSLDLEQSSVWALADEIEGRVS